MDEAQQFFFSANSHYSNSWLLKSQSLSLSYSNDVSAETKELTSNNNKLLAVFSLVALFTRRHFDYRNSLLVLASSRCASHVICYRNLLRPAAEYNAIQPN